MHYNEDEYLEHYGKKGMKWGVRNVKPKVVGQLSKVSPDGAVELKRGATLQRVVRRANGVLFKKGEDLGSDISYASFSEKDNLIYETAFGRTKNIFNKTASDVLTLTATKSLKSPSPAEATNMYFDMIGRKPTLRKVVDSKLPLLYKPADVDKAIADPNTARARGLYTHLYDAGNYGEALAKTNKAYHSELSAKGYGLLIDPSDFSMGMADTPVVILNPRASVKITGRAEVTNATRKLASKKLSEIEKTFDGKTLVEQLRFYD